MVVFGSMARFSHFNNPDNAKGFTVTLARSGRSFFVPPGSSILDALLNEGVDVAFNCGTGRCGACEVGVVAGIPHHRDRVQTDRGTGGESVMICCSGSLTDELVLDL